MAESRKPWPEYPSVLKERAIIQRGLQFYFSCKVCESLGWKKDCEGRNNCGSYLYRRITKHVEEWQKIGKSSSGYSLRR